jgi:pyridoxal phosphate enzyme (YggS family)
VTSDPQARPGEPPRTQAPAGRLAELRENLARVHARIGAACAAAGRPAAEVGLIAVTKTFPVSDIALLSELGVTDVGENKDQEARPKAAASAALGLSLTWHFVGQIQGNKAASVASYADVIHSVDRLRLVTALGGRAVAAGRELRCLIQVTLDQAQGRGGAQPAEVPALAEAIAAEPGLSLGGVMAVAPLGAPPGPAFARLRDMSDLEQAIAHGATLVRIGTALLGGRPAFVR